MKHLNKIIIIILIFCYQQNHSKEKIKIALIDFKPINVETDYANIIKNSVEALLVNKGDFTVIERTQLEIIFQEMQLKKKNCITTSCYVTAGKALSADIVLTGTIEQLKEEKKISIKIIDVNNARIVSVYSDQFRDTEEIKKVAEKAAQIISKDIQKYDLTRKTIDQRNEIFISANFNYLIPYKSLQSLLEKGYGFNLNIGLKNIFINNLMLGLESGFYSFNGGGKTNQGKFFPISVHAGYEISILNFFSITPVICGGISINDYNYKYSYVEFQRDRDKLGLCPLLKTEINFNFSINSFIKIQISAGNNMMIEKSRILSYINLKTGAIIII